MKICLVALIPTRGISENQKICLLKETRQERQRIRYRLYHLCQQYCVEFSGRFWIINVIWAVLAAFVEGYLRVNEMPIRLRLAAGSGLSASEVEYPAHEVLAVLLKEIPNAHRLDLDEF